MNREETVDHTTSITPSAQVAIRNLRLTRKMRYKNTRRDSLAIIVPRMYISLPTAPVCSFVSQASRLPLPEKKTNRQIAVLVLWWKVPSVSASAILEPLREVEGNEGDKKQQYYDRGDCIRLA